MTFGAGGDVEHRGGMLLWRGEPLIDAADIRLRGAHNRENAMAAAAVCLARGLPADRIAAALGTFAGVPHRMEEVGSIDGVLFVNDSKATNVASAVVALASFEPGTVHAILGGRGKGGDYGAAGPGAGRARARGVPDRRGRRASSARRWRRTGIPVHRCGDLERAVAAARAAARPGDVVLLSPACASYDQFRSFEERGDRFRELVGRARVAGG